MELARAQARAVRRNIETPEQLEARGEALRDALASLCGLP